MKKKIMAAGKVFGLGIFAGILAFFIYISWFTIFDRLTRVPIGYEVYKSDSDGNIILVDTHYFEEGESAVLPETETGQSATFIRKEMAPVVKIVMNSLQIICCFGTYAVLCLSEIAKIAEKDRNAVDFEKTVPDKLYGLKIGMLANVPSFILYAALIICKALGVQFYTMWLYLNMPLKPIVDVITGDAARIDQVSWAGIIAVFPLLFLLPLVCFGFYRIAIDENKIYKILYKPKREKRRGQK